MKQRNQNIESLRVVMMLLIVALHVIGNIFPIESMRSITHDVANASFFSIRSLCNLGVSTFALISGYYGVRWSLSKALKMESMAISIGGGIALVYIALNQDVSLKIIGSLLTPFGSDPCWYYSAYILLMLVSPLLNAGLDKLGNKELLIILLPLTVYNYIYGFLYHRFATSFMLLLVIYLIGQYLRRYPIKILTNHPGKIAVSTIAVNMACCFFASFFVGKKLLWRFTNDFNPLLIIAAIGLFYFTLNMKGKNKFTKALAKFAPYMFPLYILHYELIVTTHVLDFRGLITNPYTCSLVSISAVIVIGTLICWLREETLGKAENVILQKFNVKR